MKIRYIGILGLALTACSPGGESAKSQVSDILHDSAWHPSQSPYTLLPHQSIAICDTGVKEGVAEMVKNSVEMWLEAGGRTGLPVRMGCRGDRILKLYPAPSSVAWYGQANVLEDNVHRVDVPPQWAGTWTSNHEVGHVFGFAHNSAISIMNSDDNGRFMNGGQLSAYDYREIERMLSDPIFARANAAWAKFRDEPERPYSEPSRPSLAAAPAQFEDCTGADGETQYEHGSETIYRGHRYTCRNGHWTDDGPIAEERAPSAPSPTRTAATRDTAAAPARPTSQGCTGVDGSTQYDEGERTTYKDHYFICRNGRWIDGGPVASARDSRELEKRASCLGVDGETLFDDGVVTTYRESSFRCSDGSWIRE